jgi:hypothetical protein
MDFAVVLEQGRLRLVRVEVSGTLVGRPCIPSVKVERWRSYVTGSHKQPHERGLASRMEREREQAVVAGPVGIFWGDVHVDGPTIIRY